MEQSERNNAANDAKPWLFKRGVSGNPNGRPKATHDFQAMCRECTKEALDQILAIGRDTNQPGNVRLEAWRTVLVYGHGKPVARIEADLTITPQIQGLPLYQVEQEMKTIEHQQKDD